MKICVMNLVFVTALLFCWSLSTNGKGISSKVKLQTRRLADLLEQLKDADESMIAGGSRDLVPLPDVTLTEDSSGGMILSQFSHYVFFAFLLVYLFTTRNFLLLILQLGLFIHNSTKKNHITLECTDIS